MQWSNDSTPSSLWMSAPHTLSLRLSSATLRGKLIFSVTTQSLWWVLEHRPTVKWRVLPYGSAPSTTPFTSVLPSPMTVSNLNHKLSFTVKHFLNVHHFVFGIWGKQSHWHRQDQTVTIATTNKSWGLGNRKNIQIWISHSEVYKLYKSVLGIHNER